MTARILPRFAVIAVLVVAVFASGTTATWLWFNAEPPSSLAESRPAAVAPVTYQQFSDSRTLALRVESIPDSRLESGIAGRITHSACEPGSVIVSGSTPASVDGRPLVALATDIPLWRDLRSGDEGDDVTGLQKELARLGYTTKADGRVGARTLSAVADLFERAGDRTGDSTIVEVGRIVWLASASVTIASCDVQAGGRVDAGAALASIAGGTSRVSIIDTSADFSGAKWALTVDSVTVPLDATGDVSDPSALTELAAAPSFARAAARSNGTAGETADVENGAAAFRGTVALAEPIEVGAVPPSAVYSITGAEGCVTSEDTALHVTIVGSQLGKTFVLFHEGRRPSTVRISDSERPLCS